MLDDARALAEARAINWLIRQRDPAFAELFDSEREGLS